LFEIDDLFFYQFGYLLPSFQLSAVSTQHI
jgi:hypothetical protein